MSEFLAGLKIESLKVARVSIAEWVAKNRVKRFSRGVYLQIDL